MFSTDSKRTSICRNYLICILLELCKAHQTNNLAVMNDYSFDKKITKSESVSELIKLASETYKRKIES